MVLERSGGRYNPGGLSYLLDDKDVDDDLRIINKTLTQGPKSSATHTWLRIVILPCLARDVQELRTANCYERGGSAWPDHYRKVRDGSSYGDHLRHRE